MQVTIKSVDQSIELVDGMTTTYLTLELAPNVLIRAAVDESAATKVLGLADFAAEDVNYAEESEEPAEVVMMETPLQYVADVEDPIVNWTQMGLSAQVCNVLESAGVQQLIKMSELAALEKSITDKLSTVGKERVVPTPTNSFARRRTVPMDEAGNPLPPGGITETEADPGEVTEDDDGLESI